MDYRFAALLGAPYRGGNLLIHDNELLTPVGNRVTQVGQCCHACCHCRRSAAAAAATAVACAQQSS